MFIEFKPRKPWFASEAHWMSNAAKNANLYEQYSENYYKNMGLFTQREAESLASKQVLAGLAGMLDSILFIKEMK